MVSISDRPETIDDALSRMFTNRTCFKFSDPTNRVYANLVMVPDHNGLTPDKPTESAVNAKLVEMQTAYDALDYARNRQEKSDGYPWIGAQLDMIYHDQVDGTTTFKDAIKAVKDKYPKA